ILYLDAEDGNVTKVGFEQTTLGMIAFLVGVIIARYAFVRPPDQQASASQTENFTPRRITVLGRLALLYLILGGIVSFALMPLVALIPSATALVAPLGSLIIVGFCLRFWMASETRDRLKFWSTMALLPALPLLTLIRGGFLGAGTFW